MAGQSFDFFALDQIRFKRVCNFIRKVQNDFFAAFSGDDKGILFKVKIINVQAYTFADANARSKKQRKHGDIAFFRDIMVFLATLGQRLPAFSDIQNAGDFIHIQTDDGMLVKLGQRNERGGVAFNQPFGKQVFVKRSQRGVFAFDAVFVIGHFARSGFTILKCFVFDVERQIARIAFQILLGNLTDICHSEFGDGLAAKFGQFAGEILKKKFEIIGVAESCQHASLLLNSHKIIRAEIR